LEMAAAQLRWEVEVQLIHIPPAAAIKIEYQALESPTAR